MERKSRAFSLGTFRHVWKVIFSLAGSRRVTAIWDEHDFFKSQDVLSFKISATLRWVRHGGLGKARFIV